MKKIKVLSFLEILFFTVQIFTSNHFDPNQNVGTVSEHNQRIQTVAKQCKNSSKEQSEQIVTLNSYNKMKELKKKHQGQKTNIENKKIVK